MVSCILGPLTDEQREKLIKQREQYETAAEKLEDQLLKLKEQREKLKESGHKHEDPIMKDNAKLQVSKMNSDFINFKEKLFHN